MRKINFQTLYTIHAGIDNSTACGFALGLAIVVPNPWSIAGAIALCIY